MNALVSHPLRARTTTVSCAIDCGDEQRCTECNVPIIPLTQMAANMAAKPRVDRPVSVHVHGARNLPTDCPVGVRVPKEVDAALDRSVKGGGHGRARLNSRLVGPRPADLRALAPVCRLQPLQSLHGRYQTSTTCQGATGEKIGVKTLKTTFLLPFFTVPRPAGLLQISILRILVLNLT